MIQKPLFYIVSALALIISACGSTGTSDQATDTPVFLTATLALTSTPEPTFTPLPPTAVPTLPPIEGSTTTQVNVRAEPSTTSATLGMLLPSTRVQILGKDASGTWYQLLFSEGKGWVIAAYVQPTAGAEIPVIQVGAGSGSSASVLVIQRVNVRTGAGTNFETVGMLSPNDVVALTGRDPSGAWLEIEYASAPEGRGWINAEFVQASGAEAVPVIGEPGPAPGTETAIVENPSTSVPDFAPALADNDSGNAPAITVTFLPTGARAFQFSDDVSAPDGDQEDWVAFIPYKELIQISITCSGNGELQVELLANESVSENQIACGEIRSVTVQAGQMYLLHMATTNADGPSSTHYTIKVEQMP